MFDIGYNLQENLINTENFPKGLSGSIHIGEVIAGSTIMSSLCVLLTYITIII
jgi:hypothetical protein